MPAQYIYTHSTGSNVDLSARVRAYRTSMSANAEEGSTAISTIIVDDEESGIDIRGLRQFDWKESSESSNSQIIFRGWTANRDISRGPFKVQRSRQWSVNISDLNSALNRRIMRGADANRPAETDVARIQWAVGTTELNILTDSTYIATTNPTAMDANDYRNQRVFDIIDDCAQQSGKNYFLILNELFSPPRLGLFYDLASSTAYSSTVRLTNVLADVDSTTTYAVLNDVTKLNRDPSRVYPTVIVPYNGGDVYLNDPSISANFFPRDTMAPAVNVHSASVARARGLRYLADIATEEDRITTGYIVPLARVNRLREGHTFQAKFSHLPGYTDYTWLRVLKRTVTAISEEFYRVELECSPAAGSVAGSPACSTAINGGSHFTSTATNIGCFNWTSSPLGTVISLSPSSASVIFAVMGGIQCSFEPGPFNAVSSPYTLLGAGTDSDGVAGYRANTTSGGTFAGSFTGGDVAWKAAIAASIPTSAAAPVQTAHANTGSTVTLGATPTVGNILVTVSYAIREVPGTPAGWTTLASDRSLIDVSGVSGVGLAIMARCVQAGDTTTVTIPNGSFGHSNYVSEWAIT